MLFFDAHLDLSLNALDFRRDLSLPNEQLRKQEVGMNDFAGRSRSTVTFGEMRRGTIGLSVATLLAPCRQPENPTMGWSTPEQAWAHTMGQLHWYREMESASEMVQIKNKSDLEQQFQNWSEATEATEEGKSKDVSKLPLAYLLSIEGADPLVEISYLEKLVDEGLRAIGPVHYGFGRYGFGTDTEGSFSPKGFELLKEIERLGLILDVTHLCDTCFWEALEVFEGPIWASHSNCRALVDHNRQFADDQLKALIDRGAVIGAALDAWMMVPDWERGKTTPQDAGVKLSHLVDHIDHVCQLAGNADHSGIGSDLDGGFGTEQTPVDLQSIADLQKLPSLLEERGYSDEAIRKIAHGNFVEFLLRSLPS